MKYDSNRHRRRSIRLDGYDYSRAGAYFVTVCTRDWACLFGEIADGQMRLNTAGLVVEQCWLDVPRHFPNVELDQFVVMPNHVHGIMAIVETVGATHASPITMSRTIDDNVGVTRPSSPVRVSWPVIGYARATHASPPRRAGPKGRSIGAVVGSFKSAVTKRINELSDTSGTSVWQRNYHERIVRDDASLDTMREYIVRNPLRWDYGRENPTRATHASPLQFDP